MTRPLPDNVRAWLAHPLPREVDTPLRRLAQARGVVRLAVMPDVHFAGGVCVGTVAATRDVVYPEAVGGDIGCGVLCVPLAGDLTDFVGHVDPAGFYAELRRQVPALRQPTRQRLPDELVGDEPFDGDLPGHAPLRGLRDRDGRVQFGTLGRGNHFLELQRDDQHGAWLMIHSGSRAMGPAIRDAHVRCASGVSKGLPYLEVDAPVGRSYLQAADWAVRYAVANRRAMATRCAALLAPFGLAPRWAAAFDCHHNHVRREVIEGEELWIHRKGALSQADGERGAIPGSMGTHSFHVIGRGCAAALCSSSHGAGRDGSRTEARRRTTPRSFAREMGDVLFDRSMTGRLLDEAPSAYRDVDRVMRAQKELTRIVRRLVPVLSYKGG